MLGGCEQPPAKHVDRVDPPKLEHERAAAEEFRRKAHEDALGSALPLAREALLAGDPFGAWQAGQGPAALPLLTLGQRAVLDQKFDAAQTAIAEIDEASLSPSSVVILRAVQFGISRLEDQLGRRAPLRQDPMVALQAVEAVLDELVHRTLQDDCDAACEALAAELALALPDTRAQLVAASLATTEHAAARATELARRSRDLAERPLLGRHATLQTGLGQLATALDEHHEWLTALATALAAAESPSTWTAKPGPIRPGGIANVERLQDVIGTLALSRRMAAEELIILDPAHDIPRVASHVNRWETLRRELVVDAVPSETPSTVDVARCEAALARIAAGLAGVEGVEPPRLGCERYVELLGDRPLEESALILELLDHGVIEPQRRALRKRELPELALIGGQWSTDVHTHLRRIMLLARIGEPAARNRAIDDGVRALCLAELALRTHDDDPGEAIGPRCAALGDAASLRAQVLGDPRGALAGFGLSLIGDEPARMVGFDRFFWAPLGLMQTLATPTGLHPDQFTLPDDPPGRAPPQVEVNVEQLSGAEDP